MSNTIYHIVYKTTNLINGKIYIGKHSTAKLDDGYLGSGYYILEAIKKHGKENFTREILSEHATSDEAYLAESLIVTKEFIKKKNYNGTIGGKGRQLGEICVMDKDGNKFVVMNDNPKWLSGEYVGANAGYKMTPEHLAKALANRCLYAKGPDHHFYNKHHTEEVCAGISIKIQALYDSGKLVCWNKGIPMADLYDQATRKEMFGRNTAGDKNPSAGSCWFGTHKYKCYIQKGDDELKNKLLSLGWKPKPKNFNALISVTKTIKDHLNEYEF